MSTIQTSIYAGISTGITAYLFCKGFEISRPFEKSVLVAVQTGLTFLAKRTIDKNTGRSPGSPLHHRALFLTRSANILIIPFTLYIGRSLNFKDSSYLPQIGLMYLSSEITSGLHNLYNWLNN